MSQGQAEGEIPQGRFSGPVLGGLELLPGFGCAGHFGMKAEHSLPTASQASAISKSSTWRSNGRLLVSRTRNSYNTSRRSQADIDRYNRYLAIAARVVRRSLKEGPRLQAERRGEMDLRFAKWQVSCLRKSGSTGSELTPSRTANRARTRTWVLRMRMLWLNTQATPNRGRRHGAIRPQRNGAVARLEKRICTYYIGGLQFAMRKGWEPAHDMSNGAEFPRTASALQDLQSLYLKPIQSMPAICPSLS